MKHVFPSDLVVENEAVTGLRRTLAFLNERGWCQGTSMNYDGNVCVGYALQVEGGGFCGPATKALRRVIGGTGVEAWNDATSTTFAVVRRAFLDAIEGS
jgi:hypothetical protein